MSCTGLAVSDLLCVGASMMCGITTMGVFRGTASQAAISHLNNLVGGLPQVVLSRVTSLITAWISTVRCLSVAYPTKVRFIITRTVTSVALGIIFSLVTVCTTFLIVKLEQNAKWKSRNAQVVTESSSSTVVPSINKKKMDLPEREKLLADLLSLYRSSPGRFAQLIQILSRQPCSAYTDRLQADLLSLYRSSPGRLAQLIQIVSRQPCSAYTDRLQADLLSLYRSSPGRLAHLIQILSRQTCSAYTDRLQADLRT
ncbi:hypothetical protein RRG08_055193 [Elysia crispata]|uniref:Uncharacterized protein n=1 Tax=Elysia crispata TaxID=231223 RepID=A0AAE1E656_9GAST|nr:hypothetical protein RRG08_055193 [Elysia crispata]